MPDYGGSMNEVMRAGSTRPKFAEFVAFSPISTWRATRAIWTSPDIDCTGCRAIAAGNGAFAYPGTGESSFVSSRVSPWTWI